MHTDEAARDRPIRIRASHPGGKLLRLDGPERFGPDGDDVGGRPAVAKSGRWIDLIRCAIRAERADLRREPRHPAVREEVWVGWWSGENFGAVRGRLVNLSRGGARIVLGQRPPGQGSVWVSDAPGSSFPFIRGEMVGSTPAPDACYSVRLRFAAPCPTDLCQTLICAQPGDRDRRQM